MANAEILLHVLSAMQENFLLGPDRALVLFARSTLTLLQAPATAQNAKEFV
jgi:hypothetical protein